MLQQLLVPLQKQASKVSDVPWLLATCSLADALLEVMMLSDMLSFGIAMNDGIAMLLVCSRSSFSQIHRSQQENSADCLHMKACCQDMFDMHTHQYLIQQRPDHNEPDIGVICRHCICPIKEYLFVWFCVSDYMMARTPS